MKMIKPAQLADYVGKEVGTSDWITVEQERINQFADCTEDHQFIHLDAERAAKQTPFGGTIAHGFLTLSLLPKMAEGATFGLEGAAMGVNYGMDGLRFLQPVPSGSRVRGHFTIKEAKERRPGQYQIIYTIKVEIEGLDKPALIADWISLVFVQ